MIELGYLYDSRTYGKSLTVQALSRDHSGTIHCRVYQPGKDWHGIPMQCTERELRKLDKPIPIDGWESVYIRKED